MVMHERPDLRESVTDNRPRPDAIRPWTDGESRECRADGEGGVTSLLGRATAALLAHVRPSEFRVDGRSSSCGVTADQREGSGSVSL